MKVGILSAILLLFSSVTWGQRVVPSKLDYTAVVGFTSPAQHVAFSNTGTEQLPLTVSSLGSVRHFRQQVLQGTASRYSL